MFYFLFHTTPRTTANPPPTSKW